MLTVQVNHYCNVLLLLIVMGSQRLWSQAMVNDSLRHNDLRDKEQLTVREIAEVTVSSPIRHHETIEPNRLKGEQLSTMNAHTVADALRYMSGVQMKDYGGIGGLKTVNLRSLGSQHVGIYYDGIELGNAQNGVIDLGQFSLDNVEEISFYQGQRSAIMQTASDFANAGSLYIRTHKPQFKAGEHQQTRVKLQAGSFNTLRVSGLYERRLNENLTLSANVEGLTSDGHYPFRYRRLNLDHTVAYDTTAVRQNGDVQALRTELNLFGQTTRGHWEVKAYNYTSERGIPGAIVNNVWRRGERQGDCNTMIQGSYERDLTSRYSMRLMGKYAYYRSHYQNRDTTTLMVDNTYRQHEAYLSWVNVYELRQNWSVSLNYDFRWNRLYANTPRFAEPQRFSHLLSLATALDLGKLQMQTSIVASSIHDQVRLGNVNNRPINLSPALFVRYDIIEGLSVSGFAKRSFRMPTFNDLYYTEIGNAMLRPETALQYDLGIEWKGSGHRLTVHAYHNSVHDKIVAYPKGQQFRWTMLNLGKVHVDGVDFNAQAEIYQGRGWSFRTMMQYTLQRAVDVSDRQSSYFRDLIPYTPVHSGSLSAMLERSSWVLAYNFAYTGERYCQQENIRYNHLEPWYTSDLHLSYVYSTKPFGGKITLEVNNLFDQQYDVIINYPMPGRNYLLTIQCEF